MNRISRAEAVAEGRRFYFTGLPCPRGHVARRLVAGCKCGACAHADDHRRYARDKERERARSRAYQRRKLPTPNRPCPAACELCGQPPKGRALHLDHDHRTGAFRGWLCVSCNTGLGKLGDSIPLLQDALFYLRRASDVGLPAQAAARKAVPLCSGVLDYFPRALAEVARVSYAGNEQHNPGQPLHWARGKSMDQTDTLLRHLCESGKIDTDGLRHSAKLAWRALALLQLELEAEGAPKPRGAK
jgi:hypothetical protein